MELLVLSTLKWRMQAVTPFSYLDYFLHQLSGGNAPSRQAVREATELILCISRGARARTHATSFWQIERSLSEKHFGQNLTLWICSRMTGTSCLEFRPSEIAATVAAAVAGEEHATHKAACCTHVDKVRRARNVFFVRAPRLIYCVAAWFLAFWSCSTPCMQKKVIAVAPVAARTSPDTMQGTREPHLRSVTWRLNGLLLSAGAGAELP